MCPAHPFANIPNPFWNLLANLIVKTRKISVRVSVPVYPQWPYRNRICSHVRLPIPRSDAPWIISLTLYYSPILSLSLTCGRICLNCLNAEIIVSSCILSLHAVICLHLSSDRTRPGAKISEYLRSFHWSLLCSLPITTPFRWIIASNQRDCDVATTFLSKRLWCLA